MLPLLLALGCTKAPVPTGPTMAPSSSVYLRNSFDTDPSAYLGRFLPGAEHDLDESNAMTLACSQHISWRKVGGGGVRYTELLNVSSAVSARFGVPLVAAGRGEATRTRQARVQYELTGKMVSEITDPDAFAACCKAQPDQCTDRMIGEFIEGRGAVFFEDNRAASGGAEGRDPTSGASGAVSASHNSEWSRAAEFPNPVYFAFKVTPTPYTQQAVTTCPDWVDSPPVVDGGVYVVGRSRPVKTEQAARRKAENNASVQAMKAAGAVVNAVGAGVFPALRFDDACVEAQRGGGDPRYTARVLAFVSDAELRRVRNAGTLMGTAEGLLGSVVPPGALAPAPARPAPQAATPEPMAQPAPQPAPAQEQMPPEMSGAVLAQIGAAPAAQTQLPHGAPGTPLTPPEIQAILAQLQATSFDADKVTLLRGLAGTRTLRVQQLRRLLSTLSFDNDKVEVALAWRPNVQDPERVDLLLDVFSFSTDQARVRAAYQ